MKCTICIGSSCHLKGSRQIVEELQYLVKEHHLEDKVELGGTFCMGNCVNGVNVTLDDKLYSLSHQGFLREGDPSQGTIKKAQNTGSSITAIALMEFAVPGPLFC